MKSIKIEKKEMESSILPESSNLDTSDENVLTEEVTTKVKFKELADLISDTSGSIPRHFYDDVRQYAEDQEIISSGQKLGPKTWASLSQNDKNDILQYAKERWEEIQLNTPSKREDVPINLSLVPKRILDMARTMSKKPIGLEYIKDVSDLDSSNLPEVKNISNTLDDYFATNIKNYIKDCLDVADKEDIEKAIQDGHPDYIQTDGDVTYIYNPKSGFQHANILFVGPPGAGKSAIIDNWIKDNNVNSITMTGSNITKYIANGLPSAQLARSLKSTTNDSGDTVYELEDSKQQEYLRATVFDALQNPEGAPTILFVDEFNRADNEATAALLSLIQDKRVPDNSNKQTHSRKYSTFLFTIAAMNDNDLTDKLAKAMADRFNFVYAPSSAKETYDYWYNKISKQEDRAKKNIEKAKANGMSADELIGANSALHDVFYQKKIIEALRDADFQFVDVDGGSFKTAEEIKHEMSDLTAKDLETLGIVAVDNEDPGSHRILSARGFGTALSRSSELGFSKHPTSGTFFGEIRKWCSPGQYEKICEALGPLERVLSTQYAEQGKVLSGDSFKNAWKLTKAYLGPNAFTEED